MFNSYDIRGIYNVDFDSNTVYKIGLNLHKLHNAEKIAVCRDYRESSDEIFNSLVRGITDSGVDVYDYGVTTTPMSYYVSHECNYKTTVMITASHNPKEYNGFKISGESAVPVGYETGLKDLEKWVNEEAEVSTESAKKGTVYTVNIYEEYISFLKSKIKFNKKLKAVIDLSGGAACTVAEKIFGDGFNYIFNEPDGEFANHSPNPMLEETRAELVNKVKAEKADLGIIFDGDADRVMFVDNKGKFISPDMIISLLSYYLLDGQTKEKVIMDIRSSKACSFYVREMGSSAIVWKVGHAYAKKRMREENAILGGELAGHYYLRDFFYCDSGILAAIYVMNAVSDLKKENIRLSDIIQEFSLFSHSGELNYTVDDKDAIMEKIKSHYENENYMKFYDFDGIRFDFDEWWFSLRKSNTEPYLRLVVEADTKDIMNKKIKEINKFINNV